MRVRRRDTIEIKSNLELTVRERGKIVTRRRGHNIWLNLGREYLAKLICYTSYGPPLVVEEDNRIRYMGLGIGGTRQIAPAVANSSPMVPAYAGTNAQTDIDPTITKLERPVRISGGTDSFPYADPSNVWLGQVQVPVDHPTQGSPPVATQSVFKRLFTQSEVSYGPYLTVPLSEVGLFTNAANPVLYNNTMVAYDTFDTISKTDAFELEVQWTIRF